MTVPNDWIEFANDAASSPGNFACEYNQSHAQMVYDIPFGYFSPSSGQVVETTTFSNGATNAIGFILGYSDIDLDGNLIRYLPLQHPYLAGLYASKILSAVPMAHGFRVGDDGPPTGQYFAASSVDSGTTYGVWNFVRVTIYYQTFPYIIIDDHAIDQPPYNGKEQFRFTLPKFEGGIRSLNFGARGQARWEEGQDGPPNPVSGPGAGQGELITSVQPVKNEAYADITWTWYRVPARGVFQFVNGLPCLPTNIASIMGKVNNDFWPGPGGYPPGTLLCLPPKFHEETYPISPAALGLFGNQANDLPVMYNVEFRFKYYDPQPLDPASPIPIIPPTPAAVSRGHNTAATRRGTYAVWYMTYNGINLNLYQYDNFDTLFEMNPLS